MAPRIRVLHVITRLIVGGAQENTMLTAAMLDRARFAVDVVSGPQTGSEGSLIDEVRARGVPLTLLPDLVRENHPLHDARALAALTRIARRGRYDIIHTHSSKAGILGRWAGRLARVPIIVHTVHGWGHHDRQHALVRRFYIALERATQPFTDRLIVVSPRNTAKGLADRIARPAKYVTIRSGIEVERFRRPARARAAVRAELGIPEAALVVGTVARFSPQKAPHDFIAAAITVARAVPDSHFVFVGDGPLRARAEATIAAAGLEARFHLTGLRRDVPELLHALDVFALSSLWEGLPRVLPQAMAAGLPVVATAIDGTAEAIEDGVNGRLTPPGEPRALAAAIIELVGDRAAAQRMGEAGSRRVEEFSAERMVVDIARLYEELLAAKGRGGR